MIDGHLVFAELLVKAIDYAIEEYRVTHEEEPTDEELSEILSEYGVDVNKYGRGEAKAIEQLFEEFF